MKALLSHVKVIGQTFATLRPPAQKEAKFRKNTQLSHLAAMLLSQFCAVESGRPYPARPLMNTAPPVDALLWSKIA